ncbi:hypothetical protein ACUI5U_002745 [Vibrio vulnificus]
MKKTIILFVTLLVSTGCLANDIPNENKHVVGIFDDNTNQLMNTNSIYGESIRVFIVEQNHQLTINIYEQEPIVINLYSEMESVIERWRESGLRIDLTTTIPEDQNYISILVGNNGSAYGYTNFNSPRDEMAITRLTIDSRGFQHYLPNYYQRLRDANIISSDMDIREFTRMMVRVTLIHEFGHALGLAHHDEDRVQIEGHPGRSGREIVRCGLSNSRPSIMLSGRTGSFLSNLSTFLNRPVTINDVFPSRNDLEGVERMYRYTRTPSTASLFCMAIWATLKGSEL